MASALALVVGATILLALFRRSDSGPEPFLSKSLDELSAEYGRWEVFGILPFFALTAALTYLWYTAISIVVDSFGPEPTGEAFLIVPDAAFWFLPAFFLGIVSTAIPLDFLYRSLLKERYAEYNAWQRLKHGYDGWRLVRGLAAAVVLGGSCFIALGLNTYVRVAEAEIVVSSFLTWGKERRYSYQQVLRIEERSHFRAPIGHLVSNRHHAILFTDGTEWRTLDGLRDPIVPRDREIMSYIAARAGVEIVDVQVGDHRRRGGEPN